MTDFQLGMIFGTSLLLLTLWVGIHLALRQGDIVLRRTISPKDNIAPEREEIGDIRHFESPVDYDSPQ